MMPSKDLVDSDGNHFKVLDIDGYYIPDFDYPSQENDFRLMVEHWEARDDDVVLCNYPKSGTHWVWEIIQMLYKQKAELLGKTKEEWMMERVPKEKCDNMESPRILNTHIHFSMLPKDLLRRKCKLVYTIRNPKDVAVSFYHHHYNIFLYEYNGSWDSYLKRFIEGNVDYNSWFDYVRHWYKAMEENKGYPIHVIHYEDITMDCITEIKKLADFLEIKYDDKLIQDISEKCHIDVMKKEKVQNTEHWKKDTGMYRQGKVGGWKNVFTVAQNEMFDKVYREKIADLPLNLKFTI